MKLPAKKIRNPVAVAMNARYGHTTTIMKDRRTPRGGNRNKQNDFRNDSY